MKSAELVAEITPLPGRRSTSHRNCVPRLPAFLLPLLPAVLGCASIPLEAQTAAPTATTLAVTSAGAPAASVATLTAVTLTATVTAAGAPLKTGLVNFCDAAATYCTDIHILATASLTSNGTASYKFIPGPAPTAIKQSSSPTRRTLPAPPPQSPSLSPAR